MCTLLCHASFTFLRFTPFVMCIWRSLLLLNSIPLTSPPFAHLFSSEQAFGLGPVFSYYEVRLLVTLSCMSFCKHMFLFPLSDFIFKIAGCPMILSFLRRELGDYGRGEEGRKRQMQDSSISFHRWGIGVRCRLKEDFHKHLRST